FVALAMARGFLSLSVGQALAGAGSAAIWMSAPVLATGAVDARHRGAVMGLLSSTMGIGIVAASQGTAAIRRIEGSDALWRPTWVGAALFTVGLLGVILLRLSTPPTAEVSSGISLRLLRTVPHWLALSTGYWLSGLLTSSFSPFFGAALEDAGMSRSHVAALYSLFGLAAAAAMLFGRLSDRIGRRPVLLGALVTMAGACGLVLLGREPWAALAAALFGVASFTYPVLIAASLSDHLQGRAFANALGALTLIYGTALALGPVVAGRIGDSRYGFDLVFAALAGCALLAAGFIARLEPGRVAPAGPGG
ncbi:MAG: MFS transporter, partial [Acidimicrobiales bacterium]